MTQADTNQQPENQQSGETSPEEVRRLREAVLGWLEKTTASKSKPHQKPTQAPPAPPRPIEPPTKATRPDVAAKSPQAPLLQRIEPHPAVEKPKRVHKEKGTWRRTVSLVGGGV